MMAARPLAPHHLVLAATGVVAGIAAWPSLPGSHLPDTLLPRVLLAWLLPATALALPLLVDDLWRRGWRRGAPPAAGIAAASALAGAAAVRDVLTAAVVFVVALHVMVLALVTGVDATVAGVPPARLVVVLLGGLLLCLGNVLPRVRPNAALGIRTRRLLDNDAAWAGVHRVAGYACVAVGAVAIAAALLLPGPRIGMAVSAAAMAGAGAVASAYRRWTHA